MVYIKSNLIESELVLNHNQNGLESFPLFIDRSTNSWNGRTFGLESDSIA